MAGSRFNINKWFAAEPTVGSVKPFVLAGGGPLVFDPRNSTAIKRQARATFVFGSGADLQLIKHLSARSQYRGFVYKTPDFGLAELKADTYTHAAVPSAGLVFTF
jgi:outer membrane immunogenic protein